LIFLDFCAAVNILFAVLCNFKETQKLCRNKQMCCNQDKKNGPSNNQQVVSEAAALVFAF